MASQKGNADPPNAAVPNAAVPNAAVSDSLMSNAYDFDGGSDGGQVQVSSISTLSPLSHQTQLITLNPLHREPPFSIKPIFLSSSYHAHQTPSSTSNLTFSLHITFLLRLTLPTYLPFFSLSTCHPVQPHFPHQPSLMLSLAFTFIYLLSRLHSQTSKRVNPLSLIGANSLITDTAFRRLALAGARGRRQRLGQLSTPTPTPLPTRAIKKAFARYQNCFPLDYSSEESDGVADPHTDGFSASLLANKPLRIRKPVAAAGPATAGPTPAGGPSAGPQYGNNNGTGTGISTSTLNSQVTDAAAAVSESALGRQTAAYREQRRLCSAEFDIVLVVVKDEMDKFAERMDIQDKDMLCLIRRVGSLEERADFFEEQWADNDYRPRAGEGGARPRARAVGGFEAEVW